MYDLIVFNVTPLNLIVTSLNLIEHRGPAHRARLRGHNVGRAVAVPAHEGQEGVLPVRQRRARAEDRQHGGGAGAAADRHLRQVCGQVKLFF